MEEYECIPFVTVTMAVTVAVGVTVAVAVEWEALAPVAER